LHLQHEAHQTFSSVISAPKDDSSRNLNKNQKTNPKQTQQKTKGVGSKKTGEQKPPTSIKPNVPPATPASQTMTAVGVHLKVTLNLYL